MKIAMLSWMIRAASVVPFTQVAIPVSLSQLLIGGLVGVNLFRKPKVYNKDALTKLIVIWMGVTVMSFFAALALQQFLM